MHKDEWIKGTVFNCITHETGWIKSGNTTSNIDENEQRTEQKNVIYCIHRLNENYGLMNQGNKLAHLETRSHRITELKHDETCNIIIRHLQQHCIGLCQDKPCFRWLALF